MTSLPRLEELREWIVFQQDDIVAFLSDIIAIPSSSRDEGRVIERVRSEMERLGFDDVSVDEMGSVIGRFGRGDTAILYDAHVDTVGVGDVAEWTHDPFTPVVKDGCLYGRGASDNKAAVAAMVYGVKLIRDFELDDGFTLHVAGVVQEEDCVGLAVLHIIQNGGISPDYVVLGECTDLDIYRGHRGKMDMMVTTKGVSCHSSTPDRGRNAIYGMIPLIRGIEKLNGRLLHHPFLGNGSIAVTSVECKTPALNALPDECTIFLDRRLTMGESKAAAIAEVRSIEGFGDAKVEVLRYNGISYTGMKHQIEQYFPTWSLPQDHFLVQAGVDLGRYLFAGTPSIGRWDFSTDGITTMGRLNIPTIGFGPGKEIHAHTVNDQVDLEGLMEAVKFYGLFPSFLAGRLNEIRGTDSDVRAGDPDADRQISMKF